MTATQPFERFEAWSVIDDKGKAVYVDLHEYQAKICKEGVDEFSLTNKVHAVHKCVVLPTQYLKQLEERVRELEAALSQALSLKEIESIQTFHALGVMDGEEQNLSGRTLKNIRIAQNVYREIRAAFERKSRAIDTVLKEE